MRQSKLFTKTTKETPKDEVSTNAQLLIRAGFIDKVMAGVYTYLPLGLRVLNKIENIIREEMNLAGGQEILMPSLTSKESWEKTKRWDNYDTLFRFTSHFSKNDYVLGPTHEEVVTPLAGKYSLSYKNLPFSLFQIQTKFRDEKRAKSGILRGREFRMKDLYSFHTDEKDVEEYYEKMKVHYKNIFDKVGIGEQTHITFASGGAFSKYSHEFQTITEAGEDKIFVCKKCKVAINNEIFEEQKVCPECEGSEFEEQKAIEVGNIFKLKTRFSDAFDLKFTDKDGKQKPVVMGCYGIGPARVMGSIVEVHHDENGMIWPESIAPFLVHLVSLCNDEVDIAKADKLYESLTNQGIEVLYDDREDTRAGQKFVDSDLIGIPKRVVISTKTLKQGSVEIKDRKSNKTDIKKIEELKKYL
ncbi:MAG: aminoacyl--tRNA ligase-related protein [bacterium]|nr:aminoacyl--tRNA ligase-related protein [bacterium]